MRAQLATLVDNRADIFVGEVELVAVLSSPATGAMQVTSTCGVEKNRPWDIALLTLTRLLLNRPCKQVGVHDERLEQA